VVAGPGLGLYALAEATSDFLPYRHGVWVERPQLWYYLPSIVTFYLFGTIYELD